MEKKTMVENYIRAAYEKGVFAGTWLLAENGEIVTNGAVGFRDPEGRLPMREDSIFDIGSVSKQFTAAVIAGGATAAYAFFSAAAGAMPSLGFTGRYEYVTE